MCILWRILLVVVILFEAKGLEDRTTKGAPVMTSVKNEHEKEMLKIVADRIYNILGHNNQIALSRPTVEDEANNVLLSVMSMALGREVSAPPAEAANKFLENLTKLISEASMQFQQHGQPVEHQMAVTSKFTPDANLKIGQKSESVLATPKTTIFLKPLNNKLGDLLIKTPMDGKSLVLPANVKVQRKTTEDLKSQDVKGVTDKALLDVQKKETEQPVLKLMPHVIFVDNDGREFKLVGVGKQPAGCKNGDCLSVDEKSKEVLAFKKPGSKDYLVLADHNGQEFFTSGVQLCDSPTKFGRSTYSAPNLGLLTPHVRRDVNLEDDGISVQWDNEADPNHLKRESGKSELGPDEFKKDVDALFKSEGMRDVNNPPNPKPDKLMEAVAAKGKEKLLAKEKPFRRRRRRHRNMRGRHVASREDEVSDGSLRHERQTGQENSENEWQKKLLQALKDDSKDLDLLGGRRALVDAAECQGDCLQKKRRKRSVDLDNGQDSTNSPDNVLGPNLEVNNPVAVRSSENSSCTDCADGRPLDGKGNLMDLKEGIKIIAIEPNSALGQHSIGAPTIASKLPDEEFNMIQPSTAPDEEDRVLFTDDFHRVPLMVTDFPALDLAGLGLPWMLDSVASPKPLWPNDLKLYETLPVHESLPGLGTVIYPEWTPAPIAEGNADAGESSVTEEPLLPGFDNGAPEGKDGPSIAELGSQFAESILFRVRNSNQMKQMFGAGLQLNPVKVSRNPTDSHSPQYDSALSILLKTLMLNIEKIAEEDIQYRSCVNLEDDLRYFLNSLIGLPYLGTMPQEYHSNIARAERSNSLVLRRDELVNLLDDYRQLPRTEQEKAVGVKSFIESELEEVQETMTLPIGPRSHLNIYRASSSRKSKSNPAKTRSKPDVTIGPGGKTGSTTESVAQKWLQDINPFNIKRWNSLTTKSENKPSGLGENDATQKS